MRLYPDGDCELTVIADLKSGETITKERIDKARRFARRRDAVFVEWHRWRRAVRLMLVVDPEKVG